jgi:hypothetical protein
VTRRGGRVCRSHAGAVASVNAPRSTTRRPATAAGLRVRRRAPRRVIQMLARTTGPRAGQLAAAVASRWWANARPSGRVSGSREWARRSRREASSNISSSRPVSSRRYWTTQTSARRGFPRRTEYASARRSVNVRETPWSSASLGGVPGARARSMARFLTVRTMSNASGLLTQSIECGPCLPRSINATPPSGPWRVRRQATAFRGWLHRTDQAFAV